MICKFYLWRKPDDQDYVTPKIQLVKRNLFKELKVGQIIEVVTIKEVILI